MKLKKIKLLFTLLLQNFLAYVYLKKIKNTLPDRLGNPESLTE